MIFVLGKIYCNTCTCNLSLYTYVCRVFLENNFRGARPSKRTCTVKSSAARSTSTSRNYSKNEGSGGVWAIKPFQNWKKAVEKINYS